ncbi:hypothetical protein LCGC14_0146570 [marine sediment metagenome]|uniref:Uncharacterized protein n=1 Tax=marine sediment metagenome TaxID=412755 RepID=A0A0F9V002_9ZZZZ
MLKLAASQVVKKFGLDTAANQATGFLIEPEDHFHLTIGKEFLKVPHDSLVLCLSVAIRPWRSWVGEKDDPYPFRLRGKQNLSQMKNYLGEFQQATLNIGAYVFFCPNSYTAKQWWEERRLGQLSLEIQY